MLLVSKFDHCLSDLLNRWRICRLRRWSPIMATNISPQPTSWNLPFFHLRSPGQQGAAGIETCRDNRAHRARSCCSRALCRSCQTVLRLGWRGGASISTRPARFQGGEALPSSASAWGEADCTSDLDEGPIIEHDLERISDQDTPGDLIRKGRKIERQILARAVRL